MAKMRKRMVALSAVAAMTAAVLAACGGGSDNPPSGGSTGDGEASAKGGTLQYLQHFPFESTDPQRIYYGVELANFRRTLYRSLVAFPFDNDPDVANTPVPDLATDTGTSTEGGKVWSFTLKDGIKWEDGSDITCEDFKYGASRAFADDVLTGGAGFYIKGYLDIPADPKGGSMYKGPYRGDGQELFDKAVTCDGKTITYNFNKPWPDFPLSVASLMATDPYKESIDKGDRSKWVVMSNGPYKVDGGTWDVNKGATFVRNENYDPATDSPDLLRQANPDQINYELYTAPEPILDRLVADAGDDKNAVTAARIPPAYFSQIEGPVADRTATVESPYTNYLVPNQKTLTDPKVRQALAIATNVDGYIKAEGGEKAGVPAESIINPGLPGYTEQEMFSGSNEGDPDAAKALLEEAGVDLPYPIKYTYGQSETQDKTAAILKEGWEKAGFQVTLDPLADTYYDVINQPDKDSDVVWAGWGADWPSAMTVLPPLFDSRQNFATDANGNVTNLGQDYGYYQSDEFESLVDQAATAPDIDTQNDLLTQADTVLANDVAYIPLDTSTFYWLYGSGITNFMTDAASSSYPDLGPIGVTQ
ncbi:ABC transporter substrate-binding protein [Nocardioides sp. PD653-B2]|uniref:ABC transporter substrate-binding protein n=1 Tax=Nocardioides sp. PD653-B2 TaxID=1892811 RepID=UPI0009F069F3|nr:ABC transporter substrate-binding protein [Nocardioides sp. PD653-B2]GAW49462.1 Extracellular solute-binding protein, family 5 (Precursor) [Nocardioides sp. PD653-B2]